ncbi:MAG: DUF4286 family protein [Chlorobi bacterium]|nr:DUF4286 family protein [Chlorobiota bacterium]
MNMYIFNTTFAVQNDSRKEWEEWMQKTYLPTFRDILPDVSYDLMELMSFREDDSTNFSCQWRCNNPDELEIINKYSSVLLNNLNETMGEKCLHFSSVLKEHNF